MASTHPDDEIAEMKAQFIARLNVEYIYLPWYQKISKGIKKEGIERAQELKREINRWENITLTDFAEQLLALIPYQNGKNRLGTAKNLRAFIGEFLCASYGISQQALNRKMNEAINLYPVTHAFDFINYPEALRKAYAAYRLVKEAIKKGVLCQIPTHLDDKAENEEIAMGFIRK